MMLQIINQGSGNAYWGQNSTEASQAFVTLPPLGGSIIFTIDEDGELVAAEHWVWSGTANSNVAVLETIRK
jgi:hypothetical protein